MKHPNRIKHLLPLLLCLFLTVFCTACEDEEPTMFTVVMEEIYALHEPVTLTVTIPPDGTAATDILFRLEGLGDTEFNYTVQRAPTVDDASFSFSEEDGNGVTGILLALKHSESSTHTLFMVPEESENRNEWVFCTSDDDAFRPLTDWLGNQ